ncbi:MAG: hypothetical protein JXR40_10175 [Pontiellaceae bacterium]|nr:hypothetical protein [Pontiellaceae bacterium]
MKAKWIYLLTLISSFTFQGSSFSMDSELHGFIDARVGTRTQNDAYEEGRSLSETRAQLDALTYFDWAELQTRADVVFDDLAEDRGKVDLENGDGFIDLREFNLLFTPIDIMDVKVGRQILTWGTGDLLFINDLFPKDWNSFLLGRDVEYLKAPSDAVFASLYPALGTIDIAYMPRMDADRYIDGRRISFWNGAGIAGQNAVIDADRQNQWFRDHEIALRFYRPVLGYDLALYAYHGFWKSPQGMTTPISPAFFPHMNAYGASVQGTLGEALINVEAGYYDSRQDRSGTNPLIPNSEARFLVGYERELAKNLTGGVQYYTEWMMDYDGYKSGLALPGTGRSEIRQVTTVRLTKMLMNQNLILGLFVFYSPTDRDVYLRPNATYKLNDNWQLTANANIFLGEDNYSFFGQFEDNSNVNLGLRYSF